MIKQTQLIISILLGVWLSACQVLEDRIDPPVVVDGDKIEVAIAASVPAITVQTRASGEDFENKLSHVDALVFEVDEQGDETFAYLAENKTDFSSLDYTKLEIKVQLKMSDNNEKYRVVFIANMKEEIKSFFEDNTDVEDMSKDDMLKIITFTQSKKWPTGENDFRPLPMWGETEATIISSSTTSGDFGTMKLLRSVARIELNVSISTAEETNGSDVFDIKTVAIYNAREKGRAVPNPANLEDGKAIAPSLVEGTNNIISASSENNDMRYSLSNENDNKLSGIYVNEASNQGLNNENPLCLVIGAIYKGDSKITYYRVDFYNTSNQPVDILRNYTYNMTVTGVNGSGEDNEEKAVNSSSGNLTVAMTDWSDGDMKHVVFNGQNFLAVSESTLEVSKAAETHKILVQTNYPSGWKAKVIQGGEWLTSLTPEEWTPPAEDAEYHKIKTPLSFNVSLNGSEQEREGIIQLSCGETHLSLDVHVIQSKDYEYTLNIKINDQDNIGSYVEFDKTITFTSGLHEYYETNPIPPRTLEVTWTPKEEPLNVNFNPYFDWDNEETDITYIGPGYAEITVKPKRLTERTDYYPEAIGDIQIHVGEETSTAQNILIRRRHHEVYVEKADLYLLDGQEHSIQLYSNTKWTIYEETVEGESLFKYFKTIDMTSGGYTLDYEDGLTIGFKLKEGSEVVDPLLDSKSISKDLTVRIGFIDAGFDSEGKEIEFIKEYPIRVYYDDLGDDARMGDEANCYVLQTGGRGVSIPVSQANRSDWNSDNHISSGETLSCKLIWTDYNGPGSNVIKSISIDDSEGNGPETRLIVKPGDIPGNAVIAVTNASESKIYWSWHIWVVDESENFDPYAGNATWPGFRYYEFLDRNLGALKENPLSRDSWGLYYQWGRKDPFSISGTGSSTLSKMYNADGALINWGRVSDQSSNSKSAMNYSIQNPEKFMSPTASTNWLATSWTANLGDDLWSETDKEGTFKKGVFDPCPEGWKTVPGGRSIANEWTALFNILEYVEDGGYSYSWVSNQNTGRWPHAGHINQNGQHTITTTTEREGRYWTGTNNEFGVAWHSRMQLSQNQSHASEAFNKSSGLTIRCMRRVDK